MRPGLSDDIEFAHRLTDVAEVVAMEAFGDPVAAKVKPDGSLVSEVDLRVESAMLALLCAERRGDMVLSEEAGALGGPSARRWVLDPIDGTSEYLDGRRGWGTHVALETDGTLDLGIFTRPTERRRWWGCRGCGAYASEAEAPAATSRRLSVSAVGSPLGARVGGIVDDGSPAAAAIARRAEWVEDEVSIVAALLEGRVDAVLDEGGDVWDRAPMALLASEAGGRCRASGTPDDLAAPWVLYGNDRLCAALSAAIESSPG